MTGLWCRCDDCILILKTVNFSRSLAYSALRLEISTSGLRRYSTPHSSSSTSLQISHRVAQHFSQFIKVIDDSGYWKQRTEIQMLVDKAQINLPLILSGSLSAMVSGDVSYFLSP